MLCTVYIHLKAIAYYAHIQLHGFHSVDTYLNIDPKGRGASSQWAFCISETECTILRTSLL